VSSGVAILRGVKALDTKLQKTILREAKKVLRASAKDGAQDVLHSARALAPVDTGLMAAGLHVMRYDGKIRSGQIRGYTVATGTRPEMGIDADAKGYYPAAVELGYKKQNGQRVAPRSFLRAGLIQNEAKIVTHTAGQLRSMIQRFEVSAPTA